MSKLLEEKFIHALNLCQSLVEFRYKPSTIPCQAITLLCEVSQEPLFFQELLNKYSLEIKKSWDAVDTYARSSDNWRVKGQDCSLGFGVKDHCNILSFLLNIDLGKFQYYSGNFNSPEQICEFLKEWKGIDLTMLLPKAASVAH